MNMKRIGAGWFLLLMLLLLPAVCMAEQGAVEHSAFLYTVTGDEAQITAYSGEGPEMVIPAELSDWPVTSIGAGAFRENAAIERVVLPDTITAIGRSAFQDMENLQAVMMSANLLDIGDYAFKNCPALASLQLPKAVRTIGYGAFQGCASLKRVVLPETLEELGARAFDGCKQLAVITIPPGLTNIGGRALRNTAWLDARKETFVIINDAVLVRYNGTEREVDVPGEVKVIAGAFEGCDWITDISLPSGLAVIGEYSFAGCERLQALTLPYSVESIGSFGFEGCRSLEEIVLPATVRRIPESAFADCTSLSAIKMPVGITSISSYAFSDCVQLARIDMPYALTAVADTAFDGCSGKLVMSVIKGSVGERWALDNEYEVRYDMGAEGDFVYIAEDGVAQVLFCAGDAAVIHVPEKLGGMPVTSIGADAFAGNTTLRAAVLPAGIQSIGDRAFMGCAALIEANLPGGVTAVGDMAFRDCTALRTAYLPGSVVSIGPDAFMACRGVTLSVQPDSYAETFARSEGLSSVHLAVSLPDFTLALDGDALMLTQYTGGRRALTLPDAHHHIPIKTVGAEAFAEANYLEEVHIPEGYVVIGSRAYADIDGPLTVSIPQSVTEIAPDAFEGTEVTIGGFLDSAAETYAREMGIRFLVKR